MFLMTDVLDYATNDLTSVKPEMGVEVHEVQYCKEIPFS